MRRERTRCKSSHFARFTSSRKQKALFPSPFLGPNERRSQLALRMIRCGIRKLQLFLSGKTVLSFACQRFPLAMMRLRNERTESVFGCIHVLIQGKTNLLFEYFGLEPFENAITLRPRARKYLVKRNTWRCSQLQPSVWRRE